MIKIIYSNTTKAQIDHLKAEVSENEGLLFSDIVICEDRFTLSLEQEILMRKKNHGSFSLNVLSFSRLLQTLMKNNSPKSYLTKTGSIMMISKILQDLSDNLVCYRQLAKSYSTLSQSVFDVLSQLKSSMVTFGDLSNVKTASKALKMKTADLSLLYRKYEELKSDVLLDSADKLELLIELVGSSDLIANSNIHIVGFTSFTKQLYSVVGSLFLHARNVTLYVLDGQNDVYDKTLGKNIETLLNDLALPFSSIRFDEDLSTARQAIFQNLFSFTPNSQIQKVESSDVVLFLGANLVSELKFVAEKILFEVRFNNRRFSDIAIVGSNLNENHDIIARELMKYDIPCFLDNKVKLSEHIFTRIIAAMLSIALNGFEMQSVLTILHSPFFEIANSEKCDFENYLVAKGVSKRNFLNDKLFKDDAMKAIRNKFVAEFSLAVKPIADIFEYVNLTHTLVERFSKFINPLAEKFKSVSEFEQGAITLQAKEKFNQTLDEMAEILKNSVITLDDYLRILLDGLSAVEISIVPLYSDSVFIGDFSSSKFNQKKVLFAINVNSNIVPLLKKDIGLITDRDIDGLVSCNINLEPKIEMINDRERLSVFLALLNFSEKLYLSFSNNAMNFDPLTPSEIISTFSKIFVCDGEPITPITAKAVDYNNSDDLNSYIENSILNSNLALNKLAESVSQTKTGDKTQDVLASTLFSALKLSEKSSVANLIVEEKQPTIAENAFKNKTLYSVSNLESYFACPFNNFVKNALLARDRDVGYIKAVDSGNYIHEALELFVGGKKSITKDNYDVFASDCTRAIRSHDEFARLDLIPRFSYAMDNLDREFMLVATELMRRDELTEFKTLGQEIKFGLGKTIPPFNLGDGISLHGSIDYADIFLNNLRVIDYKTGHISASVRDVFLGRKFQPYIYLGVLCEAKKAIPAGALYFPIQPKFNDENESPYRMKGYVSSNMDVIMAMDKSLSLDNPKSDIVPVSITKNNLPHAGNSSCLSTADFGGFIEYSKAIAKKAIKEIRSGNISPSPYKDACEHCSYQSICGFDTKFSGTRDYAGTITKETIIEGVNNG